MKQVDRSPMWFYNIGIAALFLTGFLFLVVFSASTYCSAVDGQERNNQVRALRSYLSNCVRSAETGKVSVLDGAEGRMLVIEEKGTNYVLRVYQHGGYLVEDYGKNGSQLSPESAEQIARTDVFQINELTDRAVEVNTDAGRVLLYAERRGRQ